MKIEKELSSVGTDEYNEENQLKLTIKFQIESFDNEIFN